MMPRVKGQPAVESGRLVAPRYGHGGMRHLVGDQAEHQRRHEVERVDDEPARIAEQHDVSKYRPKADNLRLLPHGEEA